VDHVYGYAVGIDSPPRPADRLAQEGRPWEAENPSTIPRPASSRPRRSSSKGKIWLTVNGTETQKGDLTELIWNVPEIIWQLSQQVKLAAGDIIMTGTPAGVSQLKPGDKIECGVDGVGTLKVAIGNPE
jgi:fumarylpyruvate hydrolase